MKISALGDSQCARTNCLHARIDFLLVGCYIPRWVARLERRRSREILSPSGETTRRRIGFRRSERSRLPTGGNNRRATHHARKFGARVEDLERRTLLSGIVYSLTTDHSVYQAGQPIEIAFTETNTGTQPVTVSLSPTDFTVSKQGVIGYSSIWESNPENDGQPPTSVTLQPGQSVSQTATWDGTIMETDFQQGTTHELRGQPVWHVHGL